MGGLDDDGSQLDGLAAPIAQIARNHNFCARIPNPVTDRADTEASVNHAVNRTQSGTGQHRNRTLER